MEVELKRISVVHHDMTKLRIMIGKRHTFLSAVILFAVFFLIGYVDYRMVWPDGSHFDYMEDFFAEENHRTMIDLVEMAGYEHPIVTYHRGRNEEGHIHPDHPSHYSNLERLMQEEEHAHRFYFFVAFHVQILALITLGLRLFFLIDKTWEYVLELSIVVLLLSCLGQVVGIVALFFILWQHWGTASVFLILFQFMLSIIELGGFLALCSLRQKLNYLRQALHELGPRVAPYLQTLEERAEDESLKQQAREILKDRHLFWNFFTDFWNRVKDNSKNLTKDKFE